MHRSGGSDRKMPRGEEGLLARELDGFGLGHPGPLSNENQGDEKQPEGCVRKLVGAHVFRHGPLDRKDIAF